MRNRVRYYFNTVKDMLGSVAATGSNGKSVAFEFAVEKSVKLILRKSSLGGKLIFIGNGASAAISSHMAADFLKNARLKTLSFNDSSMLTCIGNDCGFEYIFEKPIEVLADKNDILIAISSSGQSGNILQGVAAARRKKMRIITLSGFKDANPLRGAGDINFYVPSYRYGHIETAHFSICHCLVDLIIERRDG